MESYIITQSTFDFDRLFRKRRKKLSYYLNLYIDNERFMRCFRIFHQFIQKYSTNDEIFEGANVAVVNNWFFNFFIPYNI